MDSKTALDKIKDAEAQATNILENAKNQAHKIILEAKSQKGTITGDALLKAKGDAKNLKEKLSRESVFEAESIAKKAESEKTELIKNSSKNIDKAVNFIKSKLNLK